ncbi:MAG: shikimate kinase [Acidimicrobiales bacterium]
MAHGPGEKGDRLLLVGMMGSGKTTVGELAAQHLGWPHLDSDAEVEEATGQTIPEIFAEQGEPAFRAAETEALRRALDVEPAVVSVAGGAVLDAGNRRMLRDGGTVVWLRAEVATLAGRVGDGHGRPLLGGDPRQALGELEAVRRPLYAEVADAVVDVDGHTPEEIAALAVGALGER